MPPTVVIRVEVKSVEPCIWRVVRVPGSLRLADLHRVLQTVLGWHDSGPHVFEIADRRPLTARRGTTARLARGDAVDECRTTAETLTASHDAFRYRYGSEWCVEITRAPGVWRGQTKASIACLDGYLAGPRDDEGGAAAYNAVLASTLGRGPRLSSEQLDWLGPGFDPERFDRSSVNRALADLLVAPT